MCTVDGFLYEIQKVNILISKLTSKLAFQKVILLLRT